MAARIDIRGARDLVKFAKPFHNLLRRTIAAPASLA